MKFFSLRIGFSFIWYDVWVGFYYDQTAATLYFCPLPCCVFRFWIGREKYVPSIERLTELLHESSHYVHILCNHLEPDWDSKALNRWFGKVNSYLHEGLPIRPDDWIERMNERYE